MEKEIKTLGQKLAKQFSNDKYRELCKKKFELNDMYNRKAEYALF